MSGFSAVWLALRESADHAARDGAVLAAVAATFAGRHRLAVLDLGCGSGSNLRALAPHLPAEQAWTLVDHDPALLDAARAALSAWADRVIPTGDGLALEKGSARIAVTLRRADLVNDLPDILSGRADLVTAAALFDLVSEVWLRRFTAMLAERRLPLYAVLTYDGLERWLPAHPLDERILEAFHRHQARDKGFGPSAGPQAAGALAASLVKLGYRLRNGDSTWRLGQADAALVAMLADGIAAAAAETGLVSAAHATGWAEARRHATTVEIGHRDLFAEPA